MTSPKHQSSPAPKIVHESRSQRQAARLRLPLRVEFGGILCDSFDWSTSGVGLEIPTGSPLPKTGSYQEATLHFPLEGCDLSLPVELEILHCDAKERRIGCRFQSLTASQQATLQFLISAYVTGDLVQAGDLLHIQQRNNFGPERAIPSEESNLSITQKKARALRHSLATGSLLLLAALLIAYIGTSIYERLYVISTDAAYVTAEPVLLDAPYSGPVIYHPIPQGAQVKTGQPLLTIMQGETPMSVASPCDCIMGAKRRGNHQYTAKHSPLLELYSADAVPSLTASVASSSAVKLHVGQPVSFTLAGWDSPQTGRLSQIQARRNTPSVTELTITPEVALTAKEVGLPATLRIDRLQNIP